MPDTTNRPTPERIADDCAVIAANLRSEGSFFATSRAERLEHLAKMLRGGAVVVRPDDVPEAENVILGGGSHPGVPWWQDGWNACRAHIFGGDQ